MLQSYQNNFKWCAMNLTHVKNAPDSPEKFPVSPGSPAVGSWWWLFSDPPPRAWPLWPSLEVWADNFCRLCFYILPGHHRHPEPWSHLSRSLVLHWCHRVVRNWVWWMIALQGLLPFSALTNTLVNHLTCAPSLKTNMQSCFCGFILDEWFLSFKMCLLSSGFSVWDVYLKW